MYKLVIADDEYEIRNGLSHYFPWDEVGFQVVRKADNGAEVLQYLSQAEADVLLCDVKMPVMNGIEVARELSARKSKIKIIFMSGYREFEYAQQALLLGVKNYLVKPTKYKELKEVFQKLKQELDGAKDESLNKSLLDMDVTEAQYGDSVIATIKQYVETYYMDASLNRVAEIVHMNPYYISQYFKQKTGENFSDYVIRIKMQKAAQLIKDPKYKLYEISEMVGYSNAKNFARSFKKYFGKSPSSFKN